jgi:Phytanoyl-CoA dioxygenase (PhyH)
MFTTTHWRELIEQGYTVVRGALAGSRLHAAQAAARALNDSHPDGGWKVGSTELWREIHRSEHPAFLAVAADLFDPLADELLDSVRPGDRLQLASTLPGFRSDGGVGKHFHIDGGRGPTLSVFNLLFGVALTPVERDDAGGFHVLPGSHEQFAAAFRQQPTDAPVHWGEVKLATLRALLASGVPMVVPRLQPGDLVVAHGFLIHGVVGQCHRPRHALPATGRPAPDRAGDPAAGEARLHARSVATFPALGSIHT